jgi:hypothetical protein
MLPETQWAEGVFGLIAASERGLGYRDDWDNVGMRLTESGGVDVDDVMFRGADALGYPNKVCRVPRQALLTSVLRQLVEHTLHDHLCLQTL